MLILEKSDNIKKDKKKKCYSRPQLKEIGRINSTTKGGKKSFIPDFGNFQPENPVLS